MVDRPDSGASTTSEEHRVREPGFDGRVREYTVKGYRGEVDMLEVEEFVTARHGSLTGGAAVEVQHGQTRVKIKEKHAYGVMVALADYFDCEVDPR